MEVVVVRTLFGKGTYCFIPTRRDVCPLDVRDDSRLGYVVLACMLDCLGKDLLSHQAKSHAADFEASYSMDQKWHDSLDFSFEVEHSWNFLGQDSHVPLSLGSAALIHGAC